MEQAGPLNSRSSSSPTSFAASMPSFSTLTVCHLLWRMRHVTPNAEVVSLGDGARTTHAELAMRVEECAASLRNAGLPPGARIATLAWSSVDHLSVLLGGALAGCVVYCVNPRLPAGQIAKIFDDIAAQCVFVGPEVLDRTDPFGMDLIPVIEEAERSGAKLVVLGDCSDQTRSYIYFDDFLRQCEYVHVSGAPEDEVVLVFYTGGTTGQPRPVEVTQRALILHALAQATVDALGISRADRVLPMAPLFHVAGWGMPVTALLMGSDLILPGREVSAKTVVEAMIREQVTVAAAVPTVWFDIVHYLVAIQARLPDLREIVTGGSAMPESLVSRLGTVTDARVVSSWGMTETLACTTYERDLPAARSGRPVPLVEFQLLNDGYADAPGFSTVGELSVRGSFVVGTSEDGRLSTGDIADIDVDGSLIVLDRVKDLVKSGGEWISSLEVESVIASHPSVAAVAVVAGPDPRWIERPVAYVVLRAGVQLAPQELVDHALKRLPSWWVPRSIRVIDRLPQTTIGKVDKRQLRALAAGDNLSVVEPELHITNMKETITYDAG